MGVERQVSLDRPVRAMVSAGHWTAMLVYLGTIKAYPFEMAPPEQDR